MENGRRVLGFNAGALWHDAHSPGYTNADTADRRSVGTHVMPDKGHKPSGESAPMSRNADRSSWSQGHIVEATVREVRETSRDHFR